jgi:hypothetical protein
MKSKMTKHVSHKPGAYPKLMIGMNLGPFNVTCIVFMHEAGKGMIVHTDAINYRKVGQYWADWDMVAFEDYSGSVTIKND